MYRSTGTLFVCMLVSSAASAQSTTPIAVQASVPGGAAISATNTEAGADQMASGVSAVGNVGIKAVGEYTAGVFSSQLGYGMSVTGYSAGIVSSCAGSSCAAITGTGSTRNSAGVGVHGIGNFGIVGTALPSQDGIQGHSWAGYFVGDLHVEGTIDAPIIAQLQAQNAALQTSVASLTSQLTALVTATGTPGILPHAIPGRIEAEDYDAGGQGVGYYDSTPGNEQGFAVYRNDDVDIKASAEGGYAIGWMTAGEWLDYTVNVPSDGLYTFSFRMGSVFDTTFHIEVDGKNISGTLTVPRMNDWDQYDTTTLSSVPLKAGRQTLRFVVGPQDFLDFQWFEIK